MVLSVIEMNGKNKVYMGTNKGKGACTFNHFNSFDSDLAANPYPRWFDYNSIINYIVWVQGLPYGCIDYYCSGVGLPQWQAR